MSVQRASDTLTDPGRGSRLDDGTQLVGLRWWPDAGEAVAFFTGMHPPTPEELADRKAEATSMLPEDHPDRLRRQAANRLRAGRRAKATLRRYVVANGLSRMLTLTFAPTTTPGSAEASPERWAGGGPPNSAEAVHGSGDQGWCVVCGRPHGSAGLGVAMREAARFVRRLREDLGVDALPYVIVPEFHKDDHVHLHLLLGTWVDKGRAGALWGHGFVDVRKFRADGGGAREGARKAAVYAGKYVAKAMERGEARRHRYEVGQGFQPKVVKRGGYRSLADAIEFVEDHGQAVTFAVHSDTLEDHEGPPFLWVCLETSP